MHQRQRAGRVAGKPQLEIAHPNDVVPVDVQGDQVIAGQGEELVRVVRHLLPASVRPEQEEAVVARRHPHVAGRVLRDGCDAVELALVLRKRFPGPAAGGRVMEQDVGPIGIDPEAAPPVRVQDGHGARKQGAEVFGVLNLLPDARPQIGTEQPRFRIGIIYTVFLEAGQQVTGVRHGEFKDAVLSGDVGGYRFLAQHPEDAVVLIRADGHRLPDPDPHGGERLFRRHKTVVLIRIAGAAVRGHHPDTPLRIFR